MLFIKDFSLEKCLAVPTKAKICVSYDPVILYHFQYFQQKCIRMLTKMSIRMFIISLLILAKNQKQLKYPSAVEWGNTLWDAMEYYTGAKKDR